MDEYTIRQAIDLIHARRYTDARKLLRPVLEVSPTNEAAWIWFASTFASPAEKMVVYKAGLAFCVDSEPLQRWIEKCKEEIEELKAKGEEPDQPNISAELPQNARDLKKVEEPKLTLPEPGKPFEWNEPLLGKKRVTSQPSGLFTQDIEEDQIPSTPTTENQVGNWMDSLRGTMDVGSDLPGDTDTTAQALAGVDLQSRFPGEEEPKPETSVGSISKKLTSIWGAITGGDEEPVQKPAEPEGKQSLSKKLSSIWDKWGEEPKPATASVDEITVNSTTSATLFGDTTASTDDDLILHPEFFEQPHPEPEPVPYDEPVIVWGTQQIETPANQSVSPWDLSTISSPPADPNQQVLPFGAEQEGSTPSPIAESVASGAPEPYKQWYEFALTMGVILFIVVVLIFGIDYWL